MTPTDKQIEAAARAVSDTEVQFGHRTLLGQVITAEECRAVAKAALSTLPDRDSVVEECVEAARDQYEFCAAPEATEILDNAIVAIRALKGGDHG